MHERDGGASLLFAASWILLQGAGPSSSTSKTTISTDTYSVSSVPCRALFVLGNLLNVGVAATLSNGKVASPRAHWQLSVHRSLRGR